MVGYLEFLAEEVLFGREVSVESFEFLFLFCELRQLVSDKKTKGESWREENEGDGRSVHSDFQTGQPDVVA